MVTERFTQRPTNTLFSSKAANFTSKPTERWCLPRTEVTVLSLLRMSHILFFYPDGFWCFQGARNLNACISHPFFQSVARQLQDADGISAALKSECRHDTGSVSLLSYPFNIADASFRSTYNLQNTIRSLMFHSVLCACGSEILALHSNYVGGVGPVRLMFSGRTKQRSQNLRNIMQIGKWMLLR